MCGHQSRGGAWAKGNQREGSAPPANPPGRGTRTCGLRGVASTRGGGEGWASPKQFISRCGRRIWALAAAPQAFWQPGRAPTLWWCLWWRRSRPAALRAPHPSAPEGPAQGRRRRRTACCGGWSAAAGRVGQQCDGSLRAGRAACMPRFGCGPPRAGRRAWSGSAEARTRCAAHARARCERADRANCERGFLQRHNDPNQRNWEKIGKCNNYTTQKKRDNTIHWSAPAGRESTRGAAPSREPGRRACS